MFNQEEEQGDGANVVIMDDNDNLGTRRPLSSEFIPRILHQPMSVADGKV